jgi:hypothetical protein
MVALGRLVLCLALLATPFLAQVGVNPSQHLAKRLNIKMDKGPIDNSDIGVFTLPSYQITDENNRPVAGASVTITALCKNGACAQLQDDHGQFLSKLEIKSDGTGKIMGLHAKAQTGRFKIEIRASFQDQHGATSTTFQTSVAHSAAPGTTATSPSTTPAAAPTAPTSAGSPSAGVGAAATVTTTTTVVSTVPVGIVVGGVAGGVAAAGVTAKEVANSGGATSPPTPTATIIAPGPPTIGPASLGAKQTALLGVLNKPTISKWSAGGLSDVSGPMSLMLSESPRLVIGAQQARHWPGFTLNVKSSEPASRRDISFIHSPRFFARIATLRSPSIDYANRPSSIFLAHLGRFMEHGLYKSNFTFGPASTVSSNRNVMGIAAPRNKR